MNDKDIHSAELVIPCDELDETLAYFVDELKFRTESIYPSDAPRVAVIAGYGVRLRLDAGAQGSPGTLRLRCNRLSEGGSEFVAPNGTSIIFVLTDEPLELPPVVPSLVVQAGAEDSDFGQGRAGMLYRDLIPDRYGGRFIASHIRIPTGGPVPDYVHHHHIQFQLIFCVKGWVRVVYEDQGEPMLMEAGDCFLQPPHIRHRVLESSDQMEVVEISCPAEHETCVDHEIRLPTGKHEPERKFGEQKFVFHCAKKESWAATTITGLEQRVTAIEAATNDVVAVNVLQARTVVEEVPLGHEGDLRFIFVLNGEATFDAKEAGSWQLKSANSVAIPHSIDCRLTNVSADFQYLEVFVSG
jgi:quercetin dioxygenase-like cupin family protein